jgi:23S rRNA (uridine2479-2'-O)-methyltransferase
MKATLIKIHSENSDYQYIETLRRNRTKRNRAGVFFVEGVRSITLALNNGWEFDALIFTREKRLSDWAEGVIERSGAKRHYELTTLLLYKLSQKEDPSELIALVKMPADDFTRIPVRGKSLAVVLDRPMSPGNIGAVIRSCDAFRADGLIVTGHSADLYDPETIRAATGSFFCIPAVRQPSHKELIPWLEGLKRWRGNLQVVGTSAKATLPIQEFDLTRPTILLAGNETHGLSEAYRALCDEMVTIPMDGCASSLNLACAVSVILYEISRQRGKQG